MNFIFFSFVRFLFFIFFFSFNIFLFSRTFLPTKIGPCLQAALACLQALSGPAHEKGILHFTTIWVRLTVTHMHRQAQINPRMRTQEKVILQPYGYGTLAQIGSHLQRCRLPDSRECNFSTK